MVEEEVLQEWLTRARGGDRAALGWLLDAQHDALERTAASQLDPRLRRRIDANDVVQQTFLEAQRDLANFRGEDLTTFQAWLGHILRHNLAAAIARHVLAAKRSVGRESPSADTSAARQILASVPAESSTPSQKVVRLETHALLVEALRQLPPMQAEAIRLRYVEGLTLDEICQRMAKSDAAIAGLLKRGLRKLRQWLIDQSA
jgi:RNA polymerase sigma-70 factor (ECF subfamily)